MVPILTILVSSKPGEVHLALYAKGMSTRDIVATFQEMYGAEVSPTLISRVTDAVLDQVLE